MLSFLSEAETELRVVGEQMQSYVQHWLSPPDPSTNHGFVSNARHSGSAAWFLNGSVLTTWKETGSLLWIHGKRVFPNPQRVANTDDFRSLSGIWKEHTSVCSSPTTAIRRSTHNFN